MCLSRRQFYRCRPAPQSSCWRNGRHSVCNQTSISKGGAGELDSSERGLADFAQPVLETELVPFVPAHLMKRQDIDALDDLQIRGEAGDVGDLARIIGPAWDENISKPDGLPPDREAARKVQHGLDLH